MRHRTALPFLDAFLKPTKHILLAYSFIITYVISAKKREEINSLMMLQCFIKLRNFFKLASTFFNVYSEFFHVFVKCILYINIIFNSLNN